MPSRRKWTVAGNDRLVRYGRKEIAVRRRTAAVQLEAQIRLDRTTRVVTHITSLSLSS